MNDRDEIREVFEQTYARSVREKNRDAYEDMYTEEAWWMPPDGSDLFRRADIGEGFDRMVENQDIDLVFTADEVVVTGEVGYVTGISDATIHRLGVEPTRVRFRALWIMKEEEDGPWKIDRQIWNKKPA